MSGPGIYARVVIATGKIVGVYSGSNPEAQDTNEGEGFVQVERVPVPAPNGIGYAEKLVDGEFAPADPPPPPLLASLKDAKSTAIMQMRDEKIDSGITFNSVRFQTRRDDRENIAGAAQLAFMALVAGAQAGNLRWHGGATDFGWIAEDNSVVTMDAPTVIGFAKATAAFKSACIFYARGLKDAVDAATDTAVLDAIDIPAGWPT